MFDFQILNYVFLSSLGAFFISLMVWFFIREKSKKVWFPILRVLDFKKSTVRKFKWELPPLLPFLFFIFSSLCLLLLSSKPKVLKDLEYPTQNKSVHIFLDMNASISASRSLREYIGEVESIWKELDTFSEISFSTTHSLHVYKKKEFKDLESLMFELGFHRPGVELASAIKEQRKEISQVDAFIIFSDANESSWKSFNWNFFVDESKIFLVDLKEKVQLQNLYIKDVNLVSAPYDPTLEWDVLLERVGSLDESRGNLMLSFAGEELYRSPWEMPKGVSKSTLRVRVYGNKFTSIQSHEGSLLWSVEAFDEDALPQDNEFRSSLRGLKQDVLLVGQPFGERQIEDPFYQLGVVFQTFNFVPKRIDKWNSELSKHSSYFQVFSIRPYADLPSTCPLSYITEHAETDEKRAKKILWLMPEKAQTNFRKLCACFHKLAFSFSQELNVCEEAYSYERMGQVMSSSGAKPVGAKVSEKDLASGWSFFNKKQNLDLTAFLFPLKPSRRLGIHHANFPLIVKDLLQRQNLIDQSLLVKNSLRKWPRISNLVLFQEWRKGDLSSRQKTSNIALKQSYLKFIEKKDLPQLWDQKNPLKDKKFFSERENFEAGMWTMILFSLLFFFMFLEGLLNFKNRKREILLFFCLLLPNLPEKAHAEMALTILGNPYLRSFDSTLKEVVLRTSVPISTKVEYHAKTPEFLKEPWYWLRSEDYLLNAKGALKDSWVYWLKKGGFLIVQNGDLESLSRWTEEAFGESRTNSSWGPIPPDHELMRSFYLVEALPSCFEKIWNGYTYDGRLAILSIPFDFLERITMNEGALPIGSCDIKRSSELKTRLFINVLMAVLATDYKRDQIHMKEILKRLH